MRLAVSPGRRFPGSREWLASLLEFQSRDRRKNKTPELKIRFLIVKYRIDDDKSSFVLMTVKYYLSLSPARFYSALSVVLKKC